MFHVDTLKKVMEGHSQNALPLNNNNNKKEIDNYI